MKQLIQTNYKDLHFLSAYTIPNERRGPGSYYVGYVSPGDVFPHTDNISLSHRLSNSGRALEINNKSTWDKHILHKHQ